MDADLGPIMLLGTLAVVLAVLALTLLVRQDLLPAATDSPAGDAGGRWFLGGALGFGVVAFTFKLAIILAVSRFPDQMIAPLLPDPAARPEKSAAAGIPEPASSELPWVGQRIWQALPEMPPVPGRNPMTPAKVALGERLFMDPALSANGRIACASCHDVERGAGEDRRPVAIGITGAPGRRNTPTVFNAAFQERLFWDGRAASLEEQVQGPLLNPDEMGMPSLAAVEARIQADPSYREAFTQAFGADAGMTMTEAAQAIAAYERTLVTPDTPYDRFVRGDESALTEIQKQGMWLFQSLGCIGCHSGPMFGGAGRLAGGTPYRAFLAARSELGRRYDLLQDKGKAAPEAGTGIWRVPSLRNVALTAPYFHNGAVSQLAQAVRVMAATQLNAAVGAQDPGGRVSLRWIATSGSFSGSERKFVSDRDIEALVAFLQALSSERLVRRRMTLAAVRSCPPDCDGVGVARED